MNKLKITFVLCLIVFTACKKEKIAENKIVAQIKVEAISAIDFKALMEQKSVRIVDVRTSGEYKEGYIKGAQLITIDDDFIVNAEKHLDKNKPVYVYCKSGMRSARAAGIMAKNGFTKIYDLQGGILDWQKNEFEVEIE